MRRWFGRHQETNQNWPDWEEARKREESEWRLEAEGEAEVSEIIVVSDAVEGIFVDGEKGEKYPTERVRKISSPKRKIDSGGIRRNTGSCERGKEYGM